MRLVLLVLCVLLSATAAHAETRVALVIGNGAYRDIAPLPNPGNDARAVAARLTALGFQTATLLDGDKRAMDDAMRAFGQRAAAADVAMVFYAGHGVQVDGRNYLVPIDAKLPRREQDLRYDFVDVAGVMDELSGAKHLRIVVLDACRDNPIAAQLSRTLGRSLGTSRGLAAPPDLDNTLIAYATAADATAGDGEGEHSPFTTALLQHIGDPGLDIRLMFGRVRDGVRRATGNRQNPFVYVSLGGDSFAFAPAGAAPPRPAEPQVAAPPPSLPEPQATAGLSRPLTPFVARPAPTADPAPTPALARPPGAPNLPALLAGRWRFSDGQACGAGRFGTVTLDDGALRFEWRLPNNRLNVAIERITAAEGNVLTTIVESDVGTPSPETGFRNRYMFEDGRWGSVSLTTGARATHVRC